MAGSLASIEALVGRLVALLNHDLYVGALEENGITGVELCFDCSLWNNGFSYDTDNDPGTPDEVIIEPIKVTVLAILGDIETELKALLADADNTDYAFKTQIDRFLTIVLDLKNKIASIQCNDTCDDVSLAAQLLAALVSAILTLVSILEVVNGLFAYLDTCGCVGSKLFEILMGRFINLVTELQSHMQDWYGIVMTFFHYSSMSTKSYVASYMPRNPIAPPPPPGPMSHACVPCPPRPPMPCPPQNHCTPYPY